jgi:hypothetical protein
VVRLARLDRHGAPSLTRHTDRDVLCCPGAAEYVVVGMVDVGTMDVRMDGQDTRLNEKLLKAFADSFYGYGSFAAPYWFIGMEEGGGKQLDEIARRLAAWDERGRYPLEDLRDYHFAVGITDHFDGAIKLQRTWAGLIQILSGLLGKRLTPEEIREYQAHRLGRASYDTALIELLALPSPGVGEWPYGRWSDTPVLKTRTAYAHYYKPRRAADIREMIRRHEPRIACFYGASNREWWNLIAGSGAVFRAHQIGDRSIGVAKTGGTAYLVADHPNARGVTNEYFWQAGLYVREQFLR